MKIRHRIPPEAHFVSDPVTAAYQSEVDRSTARGEREAMRRLLSAEARLRKAEKIKARPQRERAVLVARELVEIRRQELLAIQRMMNAAPASAAHRGTGHKKKPVPGMSTL